MLGKKHVVLVLLCDQCFCYISYNMYIFKIKLCFYLPILVKKKKILEMKNRLPCHVKLQAQVCIASYLLKNVKTKL